MNERFRKLPGADHAKHNEVYGVSLESDDPMVMSIELKKISPKVAVAITPEREIIIGTETWLGDEPPFPLVNFINQSHASVPLDVMSTAVGRWEAKTLQPVGTVKPDDTAGDKIGFTLLEQSDRVTVKLGLPGPVTIILKLGRGLGPFKDPSR